MFDTPAMTGILVSAVLGGLIGLDRTALGQFMLSQPVVAGPIIGCALGNPLAGLIIGGILELIWVLDMPIGTFVPADATVASVAATAIAILGSGGDPDIPVMGFSLLLTVLMVPATMFADHLMRQRNARIPELALSRSGRPTVSSVTVWHLAGLIAFFLKAFVLCLVLVPAGIVAVSWFLKGPAVLHRAMALYVHVLPLLGAAAVARKLAMSTLDRFLLFGALIGAVCMALRIPVAGAVGLAATAGWLAVRTHET